MRNDFSSNYLAHHGILGQKHGVRNGPPYPLDADDHSASEKKAGYKKSIGGGRNEELYSEKRKKKKEQKQLAKEIKKATKKASSTDTAKKSVESLVKNRITDEQKKTLVAKMKKFNADTSKSTKEFSDAYNKEYNKRFKNKKPSDEEKMKLYDDIEERMHQSGSKLADQAAKSYNDYINYSRSVTNSLIGEYGDTKLKNINAARYSHLINRVLDDMSNEETKKKRY